MPRKRSDLLDKIEQGRGNVYEDLGHPDGEVMMKAQLATKSGEIVAERQWSQQHAAVGLGLTQPKLSQILHGQLRGVSETKMLDGLARMGFYVRIIIGSAQPNAARKHMGSFSWHGVSRSSRNIPWDSPLDPEPPLWGMSPPDKLRSAPLGNSF